MLDVLSFIESRGGNPELIRESQRRRHAPVEAVDEVIALFEEFRVGMGEIFPFFFFFPSLLLLLLLTGRAFVARYKVDQKGSEINANQKKIGEKKKVIYTLRPAQLSCSSGRS